MAQGMANLASSLFGGMPVMGAIVRSSVSIQAGSRTRAASVLHALLLLVVCLVAGALVARVPIAALAGILVVVGVRLLDLRGLSALWEQERPQVAVTAIVIASVDLLLGLGAGVVVSLGLLLRARPPPSRTPGRPSSASAFAGRSTSSLLASSIRSSSVSPSRGTSCST